MTNWEQTLIGSILGSPEAMDLCQDLVASDFTGSHQVIWTEMMSMFRSAQIDRIALRERLRDLGELSSLGADIEHNNHVGESYLDVLYSMRGDQVEFYRNQVEDASIKRSLRSIGAIIAADAQESETSADELLDRAEQRVLSVRRNRVDNGLDLGTILGAFDERLQTIRETGEMPGWAPNVVGVRNVVQFLERTDYVTVAARPGMGKSSYLRWEAVETARRGRPTVIFNLENDELEYAKFAIAAYADIDSEKLKTGVGMTDQDWERYYDAARALSNIPLHIVTMGSPSIAQVLRVARKYVAEHNPAFIGLDYVGLVQNGMDNRVVDISHTTQQLRAFALNNKVPVIACAQMNREIEHRNGAARPQLSDLRDSGSIEQDSTQVWFPWSPWREPSAEQLSIFSENDPASGKIKAMPIRMVIAKNRNGAIGDSEVIKWRKDIGRYYTLERGTAI
jgi:replicative DNA helicase